MNNVIVLQNENMLSEVFLANAELIAECVQSAVKEAAAIVGPAMFAAAVCNRANVEEFRKAA